MIDDQYQYIYLENPKTASYSLKHALMGASNVHNSRDPRMGTVNHKLPREVAAQYPDKWQAYNKFTVVRNSWDRAVSFFTFCQIHSPASEIANMAFEDWVLDGCLPPDESQYKNMLRNYTDGEHALCQLKYVEGVDEIIILSEFDPLKRNQELVSGLNRVSDQFGFPLHELPPDKNNSGRDAKASPWSAESVVKLQSIFSEEIERFGFKPPAY